MAEAFYPFVENPQEGQISEQPASEQHASQTTDEKNTFELVVRHPARIAVYDDEAAAPRVVTIAPSDVRTYLEEITRTVNSLAREQGGQIPFTVIRECVENLIHAYFSAPTVSILDNGNTIRFSDLGPGIKDKHLALEYGTSSATEEMKRYIRGVGSGLPYASQYMEDKGGTLSIEDNIGGGSVVTISLAGRYTTIKTSSEQMSQQPLNNMPYGAPQNPYQAYSWTQAPFYTPQQPMYAQPYGMPPQPYVQTPQGAGYNPINPMYQGQPQETPAYNPMQPMQQPAYNPAQQSPHGYAQDLTQPQMPAQTELTASAYPPQEAQAILSTHEKSVIGYLMNHESCGPKELFEVFGRSQPTWSRCLSALSTQGFVIKEGQKHRITQLGRIWAEHNLMNQ